MTNTQMADAVRRWIVEDGHPIGNVDIHGPNQPDWKLALHYSPAGSLEPMQQKVNMIILGREKQRRVEVVLRANLAPSHREAMNRNSVLSAGALKRIRSSLFVEGIGLALLPPGGPLTDIQFDDVIYYDALTKDRLMASLRRLYAILLFSSDLMSEAADPGRQGIDV